LNADKEGGGDMAIQDMDSTRKYTKYKRHTNEASERIQAETINTIQKDTQEAQVDRNIIKDVAFQERVYTIFNNNLYVNAMFVDPYENGNYIQMLHSKNIKLDEKLYNISLDDKNTEGYIQSCHIASVHGDEIGINDFFLVTNQYIPVGASIEYYLQLNNGQRYQIKENSLKTPLHFTENITYGINLVTVLKPNALGESPIINDYALLYWDEQVEKNLGLINPDLQRFP
jgi:hypothetical protein